MKPPFAYYGGKTKLAGRIAALMPAHRVYCEPFAGSLAVLLAKPPAAHEVVNDLDGDVVNFWRQLRERPEDLRRACYLTPYAREEFRAAAEPAEVDLERARRWWVRVTQSYARTGPTGSGWSTGMTRTQSRAAACVSMCGRMAEVADRIRPVVIECRDAVEVIGTYDAPDTVHYVDPPYLASARRKDGRTSGLGAYATEMGAAADHEALAEVLNRCAGTVLLSGYASPLYEDLYARWHRIEWDVHLATANRKGHAARAMEVLWSNRPLPEPDRTLLDEVPA